MDRYRRSAAILASAFLLYASLVATNDGEFWPFSIYPMFSQAGQPWSRAVVREVPADTVSWTPMQLDGLPGRSFALGAVAVDHIDLGSFLASIDLNDVEHLNVLRGMFENVALQDRNLLIMRVVGRLLDRDSLDISVVPYVLLAEGDVEINEHLDFSTSE